ncbi:ATP-binding protein [Baaleninema simplex]|uniref:ATP-binding protein n=1 Tax=Baaleninema simplex TaxID=2862350 RepID=UPI000346F114|nr:ATP-binding protein [Baaleninema simplex]
MKQVPLSAVWAAISVGIAVGSGVVVLDRLEAQRFDRQYRQTVLDRLNTVRATLEGALQRHLFATRSVADLLASQPDATREQFDRLAERTLNGSESFDRLLWYGNDGVRWAYPLPAEELNPFLVEAQRTIRDEVDLEVRRQTDGTPEIWIMTSGSDRRGTALARLDFADLVRKTDLSDRVPDLEFGVRTTAPVGDALAVLFGEADLFDARPVTGDVRFGNGRWQVAAVPTQGWSARSPLRGWIRLGGLVLVLGASGLTFQVVYERQRRREAIAAATADLSDRLAHYRSIVDRATAILLLLDAEGRTIFANPYAQHFFGYGETELLGMSFAELVSMKVSTEEAPTQTVGPPEMLAPHRPGELCRQTLCQRRNGDRVWVEWHNTVLKDPQGNVTGLLCLGNDITERYAAETALRQADRRLQTLLSAVADSIVVLDGDGRYLDIVPTPNTVLWTGRQNGDRIKDALSGDRAIAILAAVRTALDAQTIRTLDMELSDSPNEMFAVTVSPLDRDAAVVVARDISDRRRIEEELLAAKEDLERRVRERAGQIQQTNKRLQREIVERMQSDEALRLSEEREREKATQLERALLELKRTQAQLVQTEKMSSLGQLAAGMAHEINNPVNFIYGNLSPIRDYARDLLALVELYQQAYPDPPEAIGDWIEEIDLPFLQEDFFNVVTSMQEGAERIRKIILSLKNFARLDEVGMKRVDLHEGIESTLSILQHRCRGQGKRPDIEIVRAFGDVPKVECFASQINQVLTNLLENAIDALDEAIREKQLSDRPCITVETSAIGDRKVLIAIADNGIGIPEAIQHQIFNPFFTTKAVGKGTGLGLSIAYQIIHDTHGGTLSCISSPGRGTTFHIQLPISQQDES